MQDGDAKPDLLPGYVFDPSEVAEELRRRGAKRVLLQLPEGLRHRHADVIRELQQRSGSTILYASEPSYGACDLATDLPLVRADLVLHIGHTEIPGDHGIPAMLVPLESTLDIRPAVEKAVPLLESPVGITTTAQHLGKLGGMRDILQSHGMEARSASGGRGCLESQVLGCNLSAARSLLPEARSFLYVGTGNFHPIGIALATKRKVIVADPALNEARDIAPVVDRLLRQRSAAIAKAKDATRWGVILGTKTGQRRPGMAFRMVDLLTKHGREATVITMATSRPDLLVAFPEEAYVSVSCPRIAIDDQARYDRPMLTPPELEILLGERHWDDYLFDEFP